MILTTKISDPFKWHPYFAYTPVVVDEEETFIEGRERVIVIKKAWLQRVERKLERNLTGTNRWIFRLAQP